MSSVVRKISIGSDYKNDAMHYSVGQQVYGGHEISNILLDEKDSSYNIYIKKGDEVSTTCSINEKYSRFYRKTHRGSIQ